MSIVLSDDPLVISLANIPTSKDDDFCHIIAAEPGSPFGDIALCGHRPHDASTWCCTRGYPDCGRPRCAECEYIWETEWERA